MVSIGSVEKEFKATYPIAKRIIERLMEAGVLRESSRDKRSKLFLAPDIIVLG